MRALPLVLLPLFAAAAPPKCRDGSAPRLTGDPFDPIHCSTSPSAAPALPPEDALPPAADAAAFLKTVAGRWEATLVRGFGRYEVLLTVTGLSGGRFELTLASKELQMRARADSTLLLAPAKTPGSYAARLTSGAAPRAVLSGTAKVGPKGPDGSRRLELVFVNGAAHRLALLPENRTLRLKAVSALHGAPLAGLETILTRTKRTSL